MAAGSVAGKEFNLARALAVPSFVVPASAGRTNDRTQERLENAGTASSFGKASVLAEV
jgi:hypothetical protein